MKADTESKLLATLETLDKVKASADESIANLEADLAKHANNDDLAKRLEEAEAKLAAALAPKEKTLKEQLQDKLPQLRVEELTKKVAALESRCEEAEWQARKAIENEMKMRMQVAEMEVRLRGIFKAVKERDREEARLRDQATAISKNSPHYKAVAPEMAMAVAMVDIKKGITRQAPVWGAPSNPS